MVNSIQIFRKLASGPPSAAPCSESRTDRLLEVTELRTDRLLKIMELRTDRLLDYVVYNIDAKER